MPYDQVMSKWKSGDLHSGSSSGPKVHSQKQAVAIMLSEKKKAGEGKTEYQPKPKSKSRTKPGANKKGFGGKVYDGNVEGD